MDLDGKCNETGRVGGFLFSLASVGVFEYFVPAYNLHIDKGASHVHCC